MFPTGREVPKSYQCYLFVLEDVTILVNDIYLVLMLTSFHRTSLTFAPR
jgi:hypothetical protein